MDLRKLEALVAAVELGSFTKAAQQLGYSQSGLTLSLIHIFFAESLRQKDRVRSFDLYQFVLQRCADSAEVLPDLFFLSILFPSQKRGAPMYQDLQPNIEFVNQYDPEIAALMGKELARQQRNIELIASENIASPAVIAAMGTILTNKYAEGYPGKRYYGGCEYVDEVECIAIERAKQLLSLIHI